jgi:predicted CXXCH cytochrome family protein
MKSVCQDFSAPVVWLYFLYNRFTQVPEIIQINPGFLTLDAPKPAISENTSRWDYHAIGMRKILKALTFFTFLILIAGSGSVLAQTDKGDLALAEEVRKANKECESCHTEDALVELPRDDLDLARLKDLLVDPHKYKGSNHGHMMCSECHGDGYSAYPHDKKAPESLAACDECHASKVLKVEPQFDISIHANIVTDAFSCSSCHDPHIALIAKKFTDVRMVVAQDNHMCLHCHDSDLVFAQYAPPDNEKSGLKKVRPNLISIHKWLPNAALHWENVRCVDCHTPFSKKLSHEIVGKDKAERNCIACHSKNSELATRLYRQMGLEQEKKYGFDNSAILANSYVIGATRHPLLDGIVLIMTIVTLGGVLAHGAFRLIAAFSRRRKSK